MAEYIGIESIGSMKEALKLCLDASGVEPKEMADRLGIDCGHLTRMLRPMDDRHFPPDLIVPLMRECKNVLPLEWMAAQMGYALHEESLKTILEAIRDAMTEDGKDVKYVVMPSGRIEPASIGG